jgi:YggT family protein
MRLASFAVSVFTLLCVLKVMLSWFSSSPAFSLAKVQRAVDSITGWYFRLFSGVRWLRRGPYDFTPVLALVLLVIPSSVFSMLAYYGRVAIGVILASLLQACWSALAFFLGLIIILFIVRLVVFALKLNALSPFAQAVEMLSDSALYRVSRLFFGKRIVSLGARLAVGIISLTLVFVVGQVLCGLLSAWLVALPF